MRGVRGDAMRVLGLGGVLIGLSAVACDGDDARPGLGQSDATDVLGAVTTGEPGACESDEDCADAGLDPDVCEIAICHTSAGKCVVAEAPDLTVCDDSDACTAKSFCRGGVCEAFPSDTVDCDDGDACTLDDCDEAGQCLHTAITTGPCIPEEPPPQGGCGDGQCDQATFESVWCPQDCNGGGGSGGNCGNGACDPFERVTCATDCPGGCGDLVCHQGEQFFCADDCAEGNPECGDGTCAAPEDAAICPDDCP